MFNILIPDFPNVLSWFLTCNDCVASLKFELTASQS